METLIAAVESAFSKSFTAESFFEIIQDLIQPINNVKAADFNLNFDTFQFFKSENAKQICKPVTCIEIKETETFSMKIFILQKGSRIPLHDHPDMYGILKVIHGTVNLISYNPISCKINQIVVPQVIKNAVSSSKWNSLIPVELYRSTNLTGGDPISLLTPILGNYHEICAVGGVAAILDILISPNGNRELHYYTALKTSNLEEECVIWLSEEANEPSFWCN